MILMRKLFIFHNKFWESHLEICFVHFQWNGTAESLYIRFPNKEQTDKNGLHSAWTISINIPKHSANDSN